jgi:beta-lactamase superfamily II metal-dependent hydrolase
MPWDLTIHHLDIKSAGDATIFIAHDQTGGSPDRVVLIDGGKTEAGPIIRDFCIAQNIAAINVIAITHFDKDHYYGITWLLKKTALCNNAIIYDTGKLHFTRKTRNPNRGAGWNANAVTTGYGHYLKAITAKANVRHATKLVNSFDIASFDPANNNAVTIPRPVMPLLRIAGAYLNPEWLIGKEIMWGNGMDGLEGRVAFASNPPPGAPLITCISANQYVSQNLGGVRFVSNVRIFDGPQRLSNSEIAEELNRKKYENAKSLGFLVSFNNFRYYVAGDLESPQEDGFNNINMAAQVFQPGIKAFVNNADDMAGRVLAMKTSHHGADTASTRAFISQMRPSAAFISTGEGNQNRHPAERTINILDGYPEEPILGDDVNHNRHPAPPPEPPFRPVKNYLTGYYTVNPLLTYGGDASETAGAPAHNRPGHIRLRVTDAQSRRPVVGQIYRGILAAVNATVPAVGGIARVNAADIADQGATWGTAFAVAAAVGAPRAAAEQALQATAYLGNDSTGQGILTAALADIRNGEAAVTHAINNFKVILGAPLVSKIGPGTARAIGLAMTGSTAAQIIVGAQGDGASLAAATAAGHSAHAVFNLQEIGMVREDAGYTAAAAIGAVRGGADAPQAAAIAAAIGATLGGDIMIADITAKLVTSVAIAAGMANNSAALAGAVAGASWWLGVPNGVGYATQMALVTANFHNAPAAAKAAYRAAMIPNNDLFNVSFIYGYAPNPATGNFGDQITDVAHSY